MHTLRSISIAAIVVVLAACGQTPPTTPQVSVVVEPSSATLAPNAELDFTASVTGVSGGVTWTATCGEVVGTGTTVTYVAPSFETECVLTATSVVASQVSGSAVIDVVADDDADVTVESNTDSTQSVATLEFGAGETLWIRVDVPSTQTGMDRRLVVEVDDDGGTILLDLVLYEEDGVTPTASTSGTGYFRPGLDGIGEGFVGPAIAPGDARPLRLASGPVVDRSVSVEGSCFGPCIAREASNGLSHVYVAVTHLGFTTESVAFYAYTEPFIDEAAPENDEPEGAVVVSPLSPYRGALEILGDVDWVTFDADGTTVLTQRPDYDVRPILLLFDGASNELIEVVGPDEAFVVLAGDYAAIFSNDEQPDGPRASVYGWYDVAYE